MQPQSSEITNKTNQTQDTTVQIQLFKKLVPEMANIALKRDMKYALKVA